MNAIVYERHGSPAVLELRDVEKPAVTENEVLVRIRAAWTNPYDWHFMPGKPYRAPLVQAAQQTDGESPWAAQIVHSSCGDHSIAGGRTEALTFPPRLLYCDH